MSFSNRRQRAQQPVRQPRPQTDGSLYRRSRTLTGSISSRVVAAVESNSQLRSPRLETHDLRSHRRRLLGLLAGSLVAVAGTLWLIDSLIVSITPGADLPQSERYMTLVKNYLMAHPLERLPFVLNTDRLVRQIQDEAPEVLAVKLDGEQSFASYRLSVTFRQPVAQWRLGDEVYLVDDSGVAYRDQLGQSHQGLLQVKDESQLPLAAQKVASRATMQFIGQVVASLRQQKVGEVSEVILPLGTLKQIDIILKDRPYRIMLSSDRSPKGQVTDMSYALRTLDENHVSPAYLDIRVEGKAFYR